MILKYVCVFFATGFAILGQGCAPECMDEFGCRNCDCLEDSMVADSIAIFEEGGLAESRREILDQWQKKAQCYSKHCK